MTKPIPSDEGAGREDTPRPARIHDLMVGLVAICVAGLLFLETFSFPVVNWTPLGLEFWPRIVLGGIAMVSAGLVILRQLDVQPSFAIDRREVCLFAMLASFVVALPLVGFFGTCTIYVFAASIWLSSEASGRTLRAGLLAVATTTVVYLAFSIGLGVRLPEGLLVELIAEGGA